MAVNQEAAESLVGKLQQFRTTLTGDGQQALDALLKTFESAARGAAKSSALKTADADVSRLNDLLRDIDGSDDLEDAQAVTPTVTTVTITTTVASHPVITCN